MDPNQLANLSPSQKEEIMQTVQQQVALANMQVSQIRQRMEIISSSMHHV